MNNSQLKEIAENLIEGADGNQLTSLLESVDAGEAAQTLLEHNVMSPKDVIAELDHNLYRFIEEMDQQARTISDLKNRINTAVGKLNNSFLPTVETDNTKILVSVSDIKEIIRILEV